MKLAGTFLAGFASGWVVRSTIDSSRGVTVGAIAAFYGVVDRAKRYVAVEREHLEDLVAEGRAKFEADKVRRSARSVASARAAHVAEKGRAA